jgi:hypothetical protein
MTDTRQTSKLRKLAGLISFMVFGAGSAIIGLAAFAMPISETACGVAVIGGIATVVGFAGMIESA